MDRKLLQQKQELQAKLQQCQVEERRLCNLSLDHQRKIEELERSISNVDQQLRDKEVQAARQDEWLSSVRGVVHRIMAEGTHNDELRSTLLNVLNQTD
ncbi:uncharacterized protein LOC123513648 isoform X2 [Portunus trituberculatus]|nr:uncharacterized protein LOC123513648 isoform X2 [Portunus trituberculatus]XP_045126871.1 uncharacterized protein LOC123513648 isoform X2 [Portunus trituberculatus]